MIAYWNGMTWECSPDRITRPESISTAYSMKTETNADKEGASPTETVGLNEEEVSLSTIYRIETGTSDIAGMIDSWKALVGKAAPLIIGNRIFGADKMQLQSVSVSDISLRANGRFSAATLGFKFKEYIEEPVVASVNQTRGSGASAVSVGASAADKASKKTSSINTSN